MTNNIYRMPRTTPTSDTGLFVEDEIKEEDNGEESELYDYEETRANSGNSDGVVPEIEEAFIPGKPLPKAVVITMTVAELVRKSKVQTLSYLILLHLRDSHSFY